jgi:hypothetical protein
MTDRSKMPGWTGIGIAVAPEPDPAESFARAFVEHTSVSMPEARYSGAATVAALLMPSTSPPNW